MNKKDILLGLSSILLAVQSQATSPAFYCYNNHGTSITITQDQQEQPLRIELKSFATGKHSVFFRSNRDAVNLQKQQDDIFLYTASNNHGISLTLQRKYNKAKDIHNAQLFVKTTEQELQQSLLCMHEEEEEEFR